MKIGGGWGYFLVHLLLKLLSYLYKNVDRNFFWYLENKTLNVRHITQKSIFYTSSGSFLMVNGRGRDKDNDG